MSLLYQIAEREAQHIIAMTDELLSLSCMASLSARERVMIHAQCLAKHTKIEISEGVMARTTKRLTKSGPKKPTKKVTCADCEHNGVGKCVTPTVIDSAHCCNQYEKKFDPYSVLKPVKSSNVLKMGWHNNIIYALFKGDKLYAFEGFTLETHGAILKSESIGKALYALGVKGKLLNA